MMMNRCGPPQVGDTVMGNRVQPVSHFIGAPVTVAGSRKSWKSIEYAPGEQHALSLAWAKNGEFLLHASAGTFSGLSDSLFPACGGKIVAWSSSKKAGVRWTAPAAGNGDVVLTIAGAPSFGRVGVQNITLKAA